MNSFVLAGNLDSDDRRSTGDPVSERVMRHILSSPSEDTGRPATALALSDFRMGEAKPGTICPWLRGFGLTQAVV